MGVCEEEETSHRPGMHWQQHHQRNPECHVGPAHEPSLSPNLPLHSSSSPSPSSSMGDAELVGGLSSGGSNFSGGSERSTPNSSDGLHSNRHSPGESPDHVTCVYGRTRDVPGGMTPHPFAHGIRFAGCGTSPPYDVHHQPGFQSQHHQSLPPPHRSLGSGICGVKPQPQHPSPSATRTPSPHHDIRAKHQSHRFRDGSRTQHAVPPQMQPLQRTVPQRALHLPSASSEVACDGNATGSNEEEGGSGGFSSDGRLAGECVKQEGREWEGGVRGRGWGAGGAEEEAVCAGCGRRISDRFYLMAVERRWHVSCLQCSQCWRALEGDVTCFARDGHIYCKRDYYMLFGVKRCARCHDAITSSELVMRARELVFHVRCFTCAACGTALAKGDHFGMRSASVFCRLHYGAHEAAGAGSRRLPGAVEGSEGSGGGAEGGGSPGAHPPPLIPAGDGGRGVAFPSPPPDAEYMPHPNERRLRLHGSPPPPPSVPQAPPAPLAMHLPAMGGPPEGMRGDGGGAEVQFFNGAGQVTRQKGRPRKRKPKDLESMTANLDLNTDSYLDVAYVGRGPESLSPGGGLAHGHQVGGQQQQRTKRMRTSFKHHQLRTMKSYFAINHNPDAKDLKQLSQKTGLPKRVLQVWFQNARAKWRRMMLKQESSKCSSEKGSPSAPSSHHLSLPSSANSPPPFHHELPQHAPPHAPASSLTITGHRGDEADDSPARVQQRYLAGTAPSLDRP